MGLFLCPYGSVLGLWARFRDNLTLAVPGALNGPAPDSERGVTGDGWGLPSGCGRITPPPGRWERGTYPGWQGGYVVGHGPPLACQMPERWATATLCLTRAWLGAMDDMGQ